MHLSQLRDHAGALRLMALWAALTGLYVAAVVHRVIALNEPVALPTYAGLSAVAAVWFALVDAVHPRDMLRAGTVISAVSSIALNAAIISRAFVTARAIPVLRIGFTLLLIVGLLTTALQVKRHVNRKDKE